MLMTVLPAAAQDLAPPAKTAQRSTEGAYLVPFAAQDNLIELAVSHPADTPARGVRVIVAKTPAWLVVEPQQLMLDLIEPQSEAMARFRFSLDASAPVGQVQTLRFEITSASEVSGTKEIQLAVEAPKEITLVGNYPNPFNPITTIAFTLTDQAHVALRVYDMLGREVARLLEGERGAGHHEVRWEASQYASGLYFYRLFVEDEAGRQVLKQKKMLLVK